MDLPALKDVMFSLEGMDVKKAVKLLKKKDLEYEIIGSGNLIYRQEPPAYAELSEKQKIKLVYSKSLIYCFFPKKSIEINMHIASRNWTRSSFCIEGLNETAYD